MTKYNRYLLDENLQTKDDTFSTSHVNLKDILPTGTPDRTVLKYARQLGFIIVTRDIRMALNAIIMSQPVVFIDQNDNRHYLEKISNDNIE